MHGVTFLAPLRRASYISFEIPDRERWVFGGAAIWLEMAAPHFFLNNKNPQGYPNPKGFSQPGKHRSGARALGGYREDLLQRKSLYAKHDLATFLLNLEHGALERVGHQTHPGNIDSGVHEVVRVDIRRFAKDAPLPGDASGDFPEMLVHVFVRCHGSGVA